MDTREILVQARLLIEDPMNRCCGAFARTAGGYSVASGHSRAVSFCAYGALDVATLGEVGGPAWEAASDLLGDAAYGLFGCPPDEVNDGLPHGATLRMFDEAIRRASV